MNRSAITAAVVCAATVLTACSAPDQSTSADSYTVTNCGHEITFDHAPQRLVLQGPTGVQTLAELGALDKVVAKAGFFPREYFSDEINTKLDTIPSLSDRLNNAGHLQITKEAVLAENPDLIVDHSETVNPDTVTNVPVIGEPGFCGDIKDADWSDVGAQIDLYATALGTPEKAQPIKDKYKEQVDNLDHTVGRGRKVAFVYPGIDGGTTYGYGKGSMADPVAESLGLDNVFGDIKDRVFEISAEQLVAANPDIIVVLNSGEDDVVGAVTGLPGAQAITAVKSNSVYPMHLAEIEPASPLSVQGAQKLEELLR